MRKLILLGLAVVLGASAYAQNIRNVRINEVLVSNRSNIVDAYGNHESWIELFNTGYENADIGGCFLAVRYADVLDTDGNKLIRKYAIPRDDASTKMEPLSYKLFYCDGTETKGTFYSNFKLDETTVDMIILYDANGRDIVNIFKFPDTYTPVADVTLGIIGHEKPESFLYPDFKRKEKRAMFAGQDAYLDEFAIREAHSPVILSKSTPGASNEVMAEVPRHEMFRRNDTGGWVMAMTAIMVVFSALLIISLIIRVFGKFMVARTNRKEAATTGEPLPEKRTRTTSYSGEEVAAIAMALKMYQEDLHIKESTIVTINRVARSYSPWSSKIYGMRDVPVKKNR